MQKVIIGLTGPIATGKTTVAKYLAQKYQGQIYGFSGPLRDLLNRLYLPVERANLALVSNILRANFGEDLISRTIAQDIEHDQSALIILDGIRRLPDIETMRALPSFHLLAINADSRLRWQRMKSRGQNADDATKTYEEFQKDELAEADRQIASVMTEAEALIDNNGTVDELYHSVELYLTNKLLLNNKSR